MPHPAEPMVNSWTRDVRAPLRLLPPNMPYRCEHHAGPATPCHALPQLRVPFADQLDGPTAGDLGPQVDILGQVRAARGCVPHR